jgi:glucuronoarabinoxylan endo-1,4-beta-xylanase
MKPSRREFVKLASAIPLARVLNAQGEASETIYWNKDLAAVDGFGISAAFHMAGNLRSFPELPRTEILDLLFSTSRGAGLSIVRNIVGDGGSWGTPMNGPTPSIEPVEGKWNWTGDEEQIWFMKEAASRGCTRFMSTVWSPPAWMKTNGNVIRGGLDPAKRQAFAEYLSAYVRGYKEHHGIDIYAVSPTNEPDVTVDYSSCYWSGEELHLFLRDHLAPTFAKDSIKAKVIVGEHSTWSEEPVLPSLNDPATSSKIDIVGVHSYLESEDPFPSVSLRSGVLPVSTRMRKTIWMTEVSDGSPNITEISDGLYWAQLLHTHVVDNNVSAWFYWWAVSNIEDRGALIYLDLDKHTFVASKRLYAIGNFSRFVRPGYLRLHIDMLPRYGIYISAYKHTGGKELVVVAINQNASDQRIDLQLEGAAISSFVPYRTSARENLATLQPVPTAGKTLALTLRAYSITTFVAAAQRTA